MNQYQEKVNYKLGDNTSCLDVSSGGSYYAVGLLDESVAVWSGDIKKENQENNRLEGHGLGVVSIVFSQDESKLAVSSMDSAIRIWDMSKQIKIREIQCSEMENWKLVFFDEQTICTAGQAGKVTLFNIANGQEIQSFSVENSFATTLDNNQQHMVVCTESGSLHVVEDTLEKHKLYHLPRLHKKLIRSVKFSLDGVRSITGSDDQEIKMTDLSNMKCIRTFFGHQGSVTGVAMNPVDPKIFATCSQDGMVKVWDMSSGQCVDQFQPFEKKSDGLWDIKFSFDGQMIGVCNTSGYLSFFSKS